MIEKIQAIYSSLSSKDRLIADFIIANTEEFSTLNIDELSERIGVSSSTISRFSKMLFGLSFPQLKVALAKSISSLSSMENSSYEFTLSDSLFQLENTLAGCLKRLFDETMQLNPSSLISSVAEKIAKADNIYIFGIGASGFAVQDLAQKLVKLGKRVIFNLDANLAILNSSLVTPNDLVIAISYSGVTKEVLIPARKAKKLGCPVVAITSGNKSKLAGVSDYVLSMPVTESTIIRVTAIYSRYGQFFIIDVLYLAVMKQLTDSPDKIMENYTDLLLELKQ